MRYLLMTTEDALRVGLRTATMAGQDFANGELVTMFGVSPASMIGGNGTPWLVGTSRIENIRRHFFATADLYVAADVGSLSAPRKLRRRERNHVAKAWFALAWIQA